LLWSVRCHFRALPVWSGEGRREARLEAGARLGQDVGWATVYVESSSEQARSAM
jgi:hypothetical protein